MKKSKDSINLSIMLNSIGNIESFLSGIDSYDSFVQDKMLLHAVLFNIRCISERAQLLSHTIMDDYPDIDWQSIENMRHTLTCSFYEENHYFVWSFITDVIPLMKKLIITVSSNEKNEELERLKYEYALDRIEDLLKVVSDETPDNNPATLELLIMSEVIIAYEDKHYPIGKQEK